MRWVGYLKKDQPEDEPDGSMYESTSQTVYSDVYYDSTPSCIVYAVGYCDVNVHHVCLAMNRGLLCMMCSSEAHPFIRMPPGVPIPALVAPPGPIHLADR